MGSFFKSKKPSVETRITDLPAYRNVRKAVSGKILDRMNAPAPQYTGNRVADITDAQKNYLSQINQWAQNPSGVVSSATNVVNKTLSGQYNPEDSLYYKGLRNAMQNNLMDTMKSIANKAAGGGRYWSGARLAQQAKSAENVTNSLNQVLGQLALKERQNQLGVIPYAMQLGNEPYRRATQAMQANDILRQLEQQRLQTAFEDWYRANYQYPQQQIANALQMISSEPVKMDTIVRGGKSSPFSRFAGGALTSLGGGMLGLPGMTGGLSGALGGGLLGLGGVNPLMAGMMRRY